MSTNLVKVANDLIRANPDKVQQARKRPDLTGWFVGQIMKATGGGYRTDQVLAVLAKRGIGSEVSRADRGVGS
jgi:aspartyl-tRNA(Asn)/glutamyl-tRNA(Gln) amidotransferase subunit B